MLNKYLTFSLFTCFPILLIFVNNNRKCFSYRRLRWILNLLYCWMYSFNISWDDMIHSVSQQEALGLHASEQSVRQKTWYVLLYETFTLSDRFALCYAWHMLPLKPAGFCRSSVELFYYIHTISPCRYSTEAGPICEALESAMSLNWDGITR